MALDKIIDEAASKMEDAKVMLASTMQTEKRCI